MSKDSKDAKSKIVSSQLGGLIPSEGKKQDDAKEAAETEHRSYSGGDWPSRSRSNWEDDDGTLYRSDGSPNPQSHYGRNAQQAPSRAWSSGWGQRSPRRHTEDDFPNDPVSDVGGRNQTYVGGNRQSHHNSSMRDDRPDLPAGLDASKRKGHTVESHIPVETRHPGQAHGRRVWEMLKVKVSPDGKTALISEKDMKSLGGAVVKGIADVLDGTNLVMTTEAVTILKEWQAKVMQEIIDKGGFLYADKYEGYIPLIIGDTE